MGHDPKCYELAEHFLQDERRSLAHKQRIESLVEHIQHAVESWLTPDEQASTNQKGDSG